jgi:hypothetical protein
MIVVRYADDTILGLQHEHGARTFLDELKGRMCQFELALHPGKTPADALWPPRGQTTGEAWGGEARNLRLPRLHAFLHAVTQIGRK